MQQKVLYVITKSNWGGAQRYVFDLASHMQQHGFDAAVALGGMGDRDAQPGLLEKKLRESGVRTIFVESFMRDVSAEKELGALSELIAIFRREKPDVVHLNSSKAGGIGALAARIAGVKKIIFTAHGWPFLEDRNAFARAFIWLASWATALLSSAVICVSDYDLAIAKKMPFVSGKAVRIYNGTGDEALGSGEIIRNAFPAGVKITGTIGELNKNKNQRALIEQAKKNSDMYVALVGEGEERKNLEEQIKKDGLESRVKLFGFMPASEVLKGFDTFALPSIKEGLPYVLIQAKRAGLPIEANRIGGVGEILDAKDMSDFALEKMIEKTIPLY